MNYIIMKFNFRLLLIPAFLIFLFSLFFILFYLRSPVLIVVEHSFISLYGEDRIKAQLRSASFSLFRRVLNVTVTDDAGADIIQYAIEDISNKPYCVLFPARFAQAAVLYRAQNPEISIIILEEKNNPVSGIETEDFFIFRSDIHADFSFALEAASILDNGKDGTIAVFLQERIQSQVREAANALEDIENPLKISFFTTYSQYSSISDLSCIIISGAGTEILEEAKGTPVIFFTWINPELLPSDVILVINDSPYAQLAEAVKMMKNASDSGYIRSERIIMPGNIIDKEIIQKIKKII